MPDLLYEELLDESEFGAVFTPLAQDAPSFVHIMGRTRAVPATVAGDVRAALAPIDPDLPLTTVRTLQEELRVYTSALDLVGGIFVVFGGVALLLAVVGLYAMMAFSVTQRTREVGIRMAIGANGRDVRRMILRQGIIQVAIGILIGLPLAIALARVSTALLYGVDVDDPATYVTVVTLLVMTALVACVVPARRASTIEPLRALR